MLPVEMIVIVKRVRYDTSAAQLIADDAHWDGSNHERRGRNTFLYSTARGRYFAVHQTQHQGERNTLEPLNEEAAGNLFEELTQHHLPFEEAFPHLSPPEPA